MTAGNPPQAAMLFAAGFGTRMGALTKDRPKPLIPVAGQPLLDHALALVRGAGVPRVVVNAHYRAEQIANHLAGTGVTVTVEAPDILDTGGGLKAALPDLAADPVLTLNTDAVWSGPNVARALASAWDGSRMGALLAVVPVARAIGHAGPGDFALDAEGRIRRGAGYVYTGAQILRSGPVAAWPEAIFSLNRIWDALGREGRLYGTVHQGGWCDVGHPAGIEAAEAMLTAAG